MIHFMYMKKLYAYSILGLMSVLIALLTVSSSSFNYRSQAHSQPETMSLSTLSQEPVHVGEKEWGTCVQEATYVPQSTNTLASCFVQFTCEDASRVSTSQPQCRMDNERFTCQITPCLSVNEWMLRAQEVCGCAPKQ